MDEVVCHARRHSIIIPPSILTILVPPLTVSIIVEGCTAEPLGMPSAPNPRSQPVSPTALRCFGERFVGSDFALTADVVLPAHHRAYSAISENRARTHGPALYRRVVALLMLLCRQPACFHHPAQLAILQELDGSVPRPHLTMQHVPRMEAELINLA